MDATVYEAAFLADIREQPGDDAVRLIYADWLDENGDDTDRARADLIRTQCRLAASPPKPEARALRRHEEELFRRLEAYLDPFRTAFNGAAFERGFVREVSLGVGTLVAHAGLLRRYAPVADVTVAVATGEWHALLDADALPLVTGIEARGLSRGNAELRLLASSDRLGPLRSLVMHHCGVTEDGVPDLLRLDLSMMTELNLGANNLRDAGCATLLASEKWARLVTLSLGANELYPPSVEVLAASPVRTLGDVNLGANYFDDDAVARLAGIPHLRSLYRLDVRSNEFGSRGATALARSPYLTGLRSLDVSGNAVRGHARTLLREVFGDGVTV